MTKHKSESLADFFNTIGGEKKKLKEEKDKIIGDLSLDNLFSSMEEESRKIKKQKKQLKKDVEAFKKILFKEDKKEKPPSVDEYIEPPRPEEEIADAIRQSEKNEEEPIEEETVVEHAVKILDKINEEVETVETEPDIAKLRKEIEVLKQIVHEQGGGGEVRLEFLDDVDRDSALIDGKFLRYQSSTKKFIGADSSGGVGAGSTWAVDSVGINTTKNVGIGTEAKSGFALDVFGNARITGILTIGTDTITLDPSADIIQVGAGITIDATNQKIIVGDSEVADSTGNAKFTGIVTASSFVGNLTGNVNSSGISTFTNNIQVRSTDNTPGRIDLYCEVSNAHYLRLQAPAHSSFSGNPTIVLPNSAGTLLLSDGSGANLTSLPAGQLTGTVHNDRLPTTISKNITENHQPRFARLSLFFISVVSSCILAP